MTQKKVLNNRDDKYRTQLVHRIVGHCSLAMNMKWFRKQGLIFLHDFTYQTIELPLFSR